MKKKVLIKLIALICSWSAVLSTTSLVARANPKKSQISSFQSNENSEKKQVEDLIFKLMTSYDVEIAKEEPKNAANLVSQLAKKKNFYGQEEKIIKAIAFVFVKGYFEQLSEETAIEIKDILKKCANNQNANEYMAFSIGSLFRRKASDAFADDKEERQSVKEILKKCASVENAKPYVTWAMVYAFKHFKKDDFSEIFDLLKVCSTKKEALPGVPHSILPLLEGSPVINSKDLYDILNLLNLATNEYPSVASVKALKSLLQNQNFCDLLKDHDDIKNTIVNILQKCRQLVPCHGIIQQILDENPFNLFDQESINSITNIQPAMYCDLSLNRYTHDIQFDKPHISSEMIKKNIIDMNSQNKKDKLRNKVRKQMNSKILKDGTDWNELVPVQHLLDIVKTNVENKFDRFMYKELARLSEHITNPSTWEIDYPDDAKLEQKGFNFLFTKITLTDRLIKQERDLIKQLLLRCATSIITRSFDPIEFTTQYIYDPYDCKKAIEKFYFECLKQFHGDNDDIEYDIHADDIDIRAEASAIALKDAQNKTKTDLNGKSEVFKKAYCETLALANAEIDAKLNKKKQHKSIEDENTQKFYDEQYNNQYDEITEKIGILDGRVANLCKIFDDDSTAKNKYREGYLIGIKERAKYDSDYLELNHTLYQDEELKNVYLENFKNAVYENAFNSAASSDSPKLKLNSGDWQKFLINYYDESSQIIEFKNVVKQQYIDGFKNGFRQRGLNCAHAQERNKKEYKFDTIDKSDLGEFYNDFKNAYEQGLQEGLKEVELKKAKK